MNGDGQWIPIKGTLTGGKKIMASRDTTSSTDAQSGSVPFFNIGQERAEAAVTLQKELLDAYEQTSRAWFARVQSEVALWSELATKLTATRSVPEALEAYTKCISKRMQMTAEDGQHLFNDCQQVTQKITKSITNGWSTTARKSG
jgi:Phasin protein